MAVPIIENVASEMADEEVALQSEYDILTYPADVTSIFEMFERLNTGGVTLTPQEVRNCIYQCDLTQIIADLNLYPPWRKVVGGAPDKRMRDAELILRFMALRWGGAYKKPM